MLSLSKVRAGYGETVVLEDVDLELPERGSLAVLGRNGVGKTTLLATIMGHTTFHSGGIRFQNSAVETKPVYERCRLGIGYVPQERMIFPSLSVHENLDVAVHCHLVETVVELNSPPIRSNQLALPLERRQN